MTTDPIVPAATRLAAKRAFIRTMFQGYETVLAVGLSANVIVGVVRGEADLFVLGVTAAVTLIAPPLAGLRSWLNITKNGIPEEYEDVALVKQALSTSDEALADVETAVQRVTLRSDLL